MPSQIKSPPKVKHSLNELYRQMNVPFPPPSPALSLKINNNFFRAVKQDHGGAWSERFSGAHG